MIRFKEILEEQELLLEWSKNDPIPEVTRMNKGLAIIMIGPPASGKSTFINNFIEPRNRGIISFSSDNIRKLLAKGDENITPMHHSINGKDSALTKRRMLTYMQSLGNFVYDFTGNNYQWVAHIMPQLRELGYTVIFIHLLVPLEKALQQNASRLRNTPEDFLRYTYEVTQKMMPVYADLKPDNYYVVINSDNREIFYKFIDGKLWARKNDHYEPMR